MDADTGTKVTLATVAEAVGVSRMTVSNAYNRPDQLSPQLRARILDTARRLGYSGPHAAARALRRGRTGVIGVLFTDALSYAFDDPAAVAFLRGLARVGEQARVGLQLLPLASDPHQDAECVQRAVVDGFVLYCLPDDHPAVGAVLERRVPAVVADGPELPGLPFVGIDDRAGARQAAEHLVALGHRRLAIVTFPLTPRPEVGLVPEARQQATYRVARERLAGYREALEAAGVDWTRVPVEQRAHNGRAEGEEAGRALLGLDPRPTAILATSDELAIGVVEAARDLGIDVPAALSVVGFDDVPTAALATPSLTTIRQSLEERGHLAGRMLLQEGQEGQRVILGTELVVRSSTARPHTRDASPGARGATRAAGHQRWEIAGPSRVV